MKIKSERKGRFLIQEIEEEVLDKKDYFPSVNIKRHYSNCPFSKIIHLLIDEDQSEYNLYANKKDLQCEILDVNQNRFVDVDRVWSSLTENNKNFENAIDHRILKYSSGDLKSDKCLFNESTLIDSQNEIYSEESDSEEKDSKFNIFGNNYHKTTNL